MDFVNQVVTICGWIIALGSAGTVIYTVVTRVTKPRRDLEEHMKSMDKDMQDLKIKLERDYVVIKDQQENVSLLTKSMFGLIEHEITGNSVDSLKGVRDELINAITDKKK